MSARSPVVAMVLAAGRGTRMRPLTDRRPKALVQVAGEALVDHALDRLAAAGIARAVVNIHHHALMLEIHLAARARPPQTALSDERAALLETGGGVLKALPMLGSGPFVTLNGDAVWAGPEPVVALLAAWAREGAGLDALMLLVPRERAHGYSRPGDFFLDDGGRPRRRGEAGSAPYVYTGAQVMRPEAFRDVPEAQAGRAFSLNPVWDRALAAGWLGAVVWDGDWVDVGTPAGIVEAERVLARRRPR
ncbi:MAG: nucleotidyltransferase family protein [Pseudomonadota bacterium]